MGVTELALVAPDVQVRNALTADPASGVRVDEVWVSIGRIKFVRSVDGACDVPGAGESDLREGGLVAELAAAGALTELELPEGDYCRVRVRLERAEEGMGPAELNGSSVVVRGVRGDGAPFVVRSRVEPDVDLRTRGAPFQAAEAGLLLAFDARAWVAATALADAELVDGVARIDEDENRELLPAFDRALSEGLSLHEDLDRDHRLSDDEAEPLADVF